MSEIPEHHSPSHQQEHTASFVDSSSEKESVSDGHPFFEAEERHLAQESSSERFLAGESEQEKGLSDVDRVYHEIQELETSEGDRGEVIRVRLSEDNPEFSILLAHGIDEQRIRSGLVTRGELLDAGFVFLNRMGDGEKPLFRFTAEHIDFGTLQLLTQEQLKVIETYERERPDIYGTQGQSLDDIRTDMLSFLFTAMVENSKDVLYLSDVEHAIMVNPQTGLPYHETVHEGSVADWKVVRSYLDSLPKKPVAESSSSQSSSSPFFSYPKGGGEPLFMKPTTVFLEEACGDLWEEPGYRFAFRRVSLRDHSMGMMPTRIHALTGSPSPFLDSGFHFGNNYDFSVGTAHGSIRVNMATFHLLSRGLSEIGDGSHDQHYATVGEYLRELYPFDRREREDLHAQEISQRAEDVQPRNEEILRSIQRRLLEKARLWQEHAPS